MAAEPIQSPATLFLGAGASAAFGFPTTREFLENLEVRLEGREKEFIQALMQTEGISDIEHVLEILDQVVELENPFLRYLEHRRVQIPTALGRPPMDWADFKKLAVSLRTTIRNELFSTYEFDPKKRLAIRRTIEDILNAICGEKSNIIHVFTTNYDSVIEEGLSDSQRYIYTDGFDYSRRGQPAVWSRRKFDELPPTTIRLHGAKMTKEAIQQRSVRLYKLHGSLQWRADKELSRVVRVETEERAGNHSRRFGENILLYPASKRPPIAEPFGTLYSYFVRKLSSANVCVVVGFSFRDPYINTVFVDYLRNNPKNHIYIVSPSADECLKNLLGPLRMGIFSNQVVIFPNKYGDPHTTSLISARMKKVNLA
jgi:hypothetical protein